MKRTSNWFSRAVSRRRKSSPASYRPSGQLLEERMMLAGDLPDLITVGRTLSSYSAADIPGHQLIIDYTVYNQQADPVAGVLLTDTLQTGVTLVSGSQLPDRNGQELAWSLGTIPAYGRASVQVTVSLADPIPLVIDTGAKAFGTINAAMVTDTAPAATLRPDAIAEALLASTPDANINDPFIQQKAAELDYDPHAIFDYLRDDVAYESYRGSLRGARGTLWSSAGNSLDEASLGVALMRASGIPARYVQGTLSDALSQELILSMFPDGFQVVGYIPPGTQVADPANDPRLLTETREHYWFQFDAGSGFQDIDTTFANAQVGQTFALNLTMFSEVPDALRAKTEISLTKEIYSQAAAAFGLSNGLSESIVLQKSFNDVDLVGRPITIGFFVSQNGIGSIFSLVTNTYTPYFALGDYALPDSQLPEAIVGQSFQEVLTNFPLSSQILTGLFLNVTLSGPGTAPQNYTKTLVDRIGYTARQGLAPPRDFSITPTTPPVIMPFDLTTLNVLPGLQSPAAAQLAQDRANQLLAHIAGEASPTQMQQVQALIAVARAALATFAAASDQITVDLASRAWLAAYFNVPRITAFSSKLDEVGTQSTVSLTMDLMRDSIRALAAPGQNAQAPFVFATARGIADSTLEARVLPIPAGGQDLSAITILEQTSQQNIPFVLITPDDLAALERLNLPAEAIARIATNLQNGLDVIAPTEAILIDGQPTTAWWIANPNTGEVIAQGQDGNHSGPIITYAAILNLVGGFIVGIAPAFFGPFNFVSFFDAAGAIGVAIKAARSVNPFFLAGWLIGSLLGAANTLFGLLGARHQSYKPPGDPTLSPFLYNVSPILSGASSTLASAQVNQQPTTASGPTGGTIQTANSTVSGSVAATWESNSTSSFLVSSLNAATATVINSNGTSVGSGAVMLASQTPTAVSITGPTQVSVQGEGSLSFYGAAASGLGVSGNWNSYSATATGGVALTLTTGALTLNGQTLAAGTYTISTNSVSFSGSGLSNTPNFAGSASITTSNGEVILGRGNGNVTSGSLLDISSGATFIGYAGSISVAAGGNNLDNVTLTGNANEVITISATPNTLATDQDTPTTFQVNIETSFADTYDLTAEAPPGWTLAIDNMGNVTATPASGLQAGTYPIRIIAQSKTRPGLVAQTTLNVTVTPTTPGVTLGINPDTFLSVPFAGALVTTAFFAVIRNTGPTADTFNLSYSTPPAGFHILASAASVTVPAGETGLVGIYLEPSGQLPAPGTPVSFSVTATSSTDSGITATETESFAMPEVRAVTLVSDLSAVATTPGAPVTTILTLQAVGNVPANVTFTLDLSPGLAGSGLVPISLAVGEAAAFSLTLTPTSTTPLNSRLGATITANFGGVEPVTLHIPVHVAAPGVQSITRAATAARDFGNPELANRMDDLGIALTNLTLQPASEVFKSQAIASLDSILSLLAVDPILAAFVDDLTVPRDELAAAGGEAQVLAALNRLGTALDGFGDAVFFRNEYNFELVLTPNTQVALPQVPLQYELIIHHIGFSQATFDVSLSGLPASVSGQLSTTQVTLDRDQFASVFVTLTQTSDEELLAFNFSVDVAVDGLPEITKSVDGSMTARHEVVSVVSVTANPPFADPGDSVNVSARLLNAVNRQQQALASFTLFDPLGAPVFTSTSVHVQLGVQASLVDVDLGPIDTTGFPLGQYRLEVTVTDTQGTPLPDAIGEGTLLIGSPVTAELTVSPQSLPPGTSTVINTLEIESQAAVNNPLDVVSQTDLPGAGGVVTNGHYVYASGTTGIRVFDIADPANPQLIRTFGSSASTLQIRGDKLFALQWGGPFGRFTLMIYSLADPENPQFLGTAKHNNQDGIPYSLAWNMVVTDTHVFVSLWSTTQLIGNPQDIKYQTGDVIAIDVSNPAAPVFVSAMLNTYGTNNDGIERFLNVDVSSGDGNLWEIVQVDANTLLVAGSTAKGDNTQAGSGVVHVVDISNPAQMAIVRTLTIPGTVHAVGLSIEGNRAFVTASQGGWNDPAPSNNGDLTGNLVLATLDISDPRNPVLIHSEVVLDRSSVGPYSLHTISLGNGLFAFSSQGNSQEQSALFVVDASDPTNLITSRTTVPAINAFGDLEGMGNFLYSTSPSGLIVYQIDAPDAVPVIARVRVPTNTGVSVVPGSFNIEPTSILHDTGFDTLVWNLNLGTGTSRTLTWQTVVADLQPGESRPVTLDTTVDFTSQSTPGQIALPPTNVFAEQVLSLDPASRTVQPGEQAAYNLSIGNPSSLEVTYDLSIAGLPAEWVQMAGQVTIPAGGSVDVPIVIASDPFAPLATLGFVVIASTSGVSSSVEGSLTLVGAPLLPVADPDAHGVVVSLAPPLATAGQGTAAIYVARITNTGSAVDTFDLSLTGLPVGFVATFEETTIELSPGASNFRDVTLVITPPPGTLPSAYPFEVMAVSAADSGIADSAEGTLSVVAQGVDVHLSPNAGPPGTTFQMTVTNTGSAADVFDLSLAAPVALVASLSVSQVSLGPGASQIVSVTTSDIDFAYPGSLPLVGVARSRGNAAVVDADSADVTIATIAGLEANYDPAVRVLPQPGGTSFLLLVENTGNAEDAYEVKIMGTSGPVSAALNGLEGEATQTIPLVRLPGLHTGAILLDAELLGIGLATVDVMVRSLNNAAQSVTTTATVQTPPTDFGDAPDSYRTTLAAGPSGGARHIAIGPTLGKQRDSEFDAQGPFNGDGDDLANTGSPDDEDGVSLSAGVLTVGRPVTASITIAGSSGSARLFGWIDFNGDGDFADAGEQIADGNGAFANLANGVHQFVFTPPDAGFAGPTFARFRVSTQAGLSFDGLANDGEVEDYGVQIVSAVSLLVAGADAGGGPHVKVYDASTSHLLFEFFAYGVNFSGGVRVAVGDVNGDGQDDVITAAGPTGGPHVRVFDGRTGQQYLGPTGSFFAYDPQFSGGVYVASADVNGDGFDDIVTGADAGGGPHVKVFDGRNGNVLYSFFAYKPELTAGVRVAAGDVNGDGRAEIITGMGPGYEDAAQHAGYGRTSQPEVRVFSGLNGHLLRSYVPFEPGYQGGVHLAAAHIGNSLLAEIIVSKANGDARTDTAFNRLHIDPFRRPEAALFHYETAAGPTRLATLAAYPGFGGSVRVAVVDEIFKDFDPSTHADDYLGLGLFTGAGPGGGPHAKLFADGSPDILDEFFAFDPGFKGGIFVAASSRPRR